MSFLYSNSTGNFTAAGTWSVIEPTTFVPAIATQETGTSNTAIAFASSTTFTGVSSTLDGLAIKVSSRSAAPTGTFSIQLAVGGVAVTNTTVTINVADIPNGIEWLFMKFPANVTLVGATTYTVQAKSTTAAQVALFRKSATANDWTFALRTTTTQAPAAGDSMIVGGEWDSAGVNSSWTVTMNNTAATVFGSGTTGTEAVSVNANSTFTWGVAASTAYVLNIAGALYINNAGTYSQGTLATPIPSTSSGALNIVQTANVQFGIEARAGSIFNTGGNPITNNALLAADAAATATSLTTNVSTGWKSGNNIALASTTRTRTDAEAKTLTADAVGTTLTINALTNAHSGTSPTQGELINLTRNVSIFGTSTALQAYININATATVNIQATECYNMGSATALKRGIDVGTTTGSCTINNCSMHDYVVTGSIGANFNSGAGNNFTFTNNVMYNIAANGLVTAGTSGTTYTINNIIVIAAGQAAASAGINIGDLGGTTITNLNGNSCQGPGVQLADNGAVATNIFGTLSGFTGHSNSTFGVSLVNVTGVTNNPMGLFSTLLCWRNGSNGLNISNTFTIIVDTVTAFGNTTSNITIGGTECDNVSLKNMTINAGVTLTCPIGLNITSDCHEIYVDSSSFGATTTHATGDINVSGTNFFPRIVTRNTTLSSPTQVAGSTSMTEGGFISLAKLNGTAGNHKTFRKYGTIIPDTVIFNSGGTSTRLTPNNALANDKLQGTIRRFAVNSGTTATVTVFLRKSVAGDGTAYNGNQPRLMLRLDPAVGVTGDSDIVLATADNTYNGTWKALTAVTPAITDNAAFQIYIDCDGTTGWINVDDWAVQ
jgi:hypothetical protein